MGLRPTEQKCHPDRSVAKGRDLLSSSASSNLNGGATLPFVIPTRISCHASLDKAVCAPFCKGKAHEMRQGHQLPQEIRGSEAEGSAVPRTSPGNVFNTPHRGYFPPSFVAARNLPTYNRVSSGVRVSGPLLQICSMPRVCSVRSALEAA
jgi:hypothetical protein